jgi:hypothetical protein
MDERKALPDIDASVPPSSTPSAQSVADPVIDELSQKMLSWSHLWFGSSEDTEEDRRVRLQLLYWLKRCIGSEASAFLTNRVEDVSLATSTPLLTAFRGRRAMIELSRRVLNDS